MDRRTFLKAAVLGGTSFALVGGWPTLLRRASAADGPYGPLQPADANGFELPSGFSSRVVATTGQQVAGTDYTWHSAPDGGATFATSDGGWIYVSNSEVGSGGGGVGMVRFAPDGSIVDAGSILSGTSRNCAGGPTPWGTWLSCEEVSNGQVWECDPAGVNGAVVRPAMGRFNHEAAAVDPVRQHVYLTEDMSDGGLYRFVPSAYPDLTSGTLYVLVEQSGSLSWATVPDPDGSPTATRDQVSGMKVFNGGEGAWWDAGSSKLWFTTKGDNRVWTYDPVANQLAVVYDENTSSNPVLTGVDNVTVALSGDVYVCEDGGNMEVVLLTPEGDVVVFARLTGVSNSEMTGVAFDPAGGRMYVSSQRNPGRTYEIAGPFRTSSGGTTTTTATTTTTTTAQGGITLSAVGYKVKGVQHADLSWSGATTAEVVVKRDGVAVATTANDGFHTDNIGAKGGGSYAYELCEPSGGPCSNLVTVTF
jgi:secreted PhoX family phosphatase